MIDDEARKRYKQKWDEAFQAGEQYDRENPEEVLERKRELARIKREQALRELREEDSLK